MDSWSGADDNVVTLQPHGPNNSVHNETVCHTRYNPMPLVFRQGLQRRIRSTQIRPALPSTSRTVVMAIPSNAEKHQMAVWQRSPVGAGVSSISIPRCTTPAGGGGAGGAAANTEPARSEPAAKGRPPGAPGVGCTGVPDGGGAPMGRRGGRLAATEVAGGVGTREGGAVGWRTKMGAETRARGSAGGLNGRGGRGPDLVCAPSRGGCVRAKTSRVRAHRDYAEGGGEPPCV